MPRKAVDLWPPLPTSKTRTPAALLRQQAALLGKHTKNLLEARVETQAAGDRFLLRFIIAAPTLGGYEFELFTLSHDVALYPVRVKSVSIELENPLSASGELTSEDRLMSWLKHVLNSPETRRTLGTLLAQIES